MRKITIAANWKMYLDERGSIDFIDKLNADKDLFSNKNIILFPSHACIRSVQDHLDVNVSGFYTDFWNFEDNICKNETCITY